MKVMIFKSTREVIMVEKTCRKDGIKCKVIPVPRSISPLCGMALEMEDSEAARATDAAVKLNIEVNIFDRDKVEL